MMTNSSSTLTLSQNVLEASSKNENTDFRNKPNSNQLQKKFEQIKNDWKTIFTIDLNFILDDDFNQSVMNDLWD